MRLPLSSRGARNPQSTEWKQNGEKTEAVFLHGTLFVYVRRARDLGRSHVVASDEKDANKRTLIKKKLSAGARFFGKKMLNAVRTTNHAAQKLVTRELGSFVEVEVAGDVVAKTNTNYNSRREPIWNEAFNVDLCHEVTHVRLRVKDRVFVGPNIRFGEIAVSARQLSIGERFVGSGLPLIKRTRQHFTNGLLDFEMQMVQVDLRHAEQLPPVVPYCYFNAHENCRVTLYQDAHQNPGGVAAVPWVGGCSQYTAASSMLGGSSDSDDGTSALNGSRASEDSAWDASESDWSDAVSVSSAGSVGVVLQHLQRALTAPSDSPLPAVALGTPGGPAEPAQPPQAIAQTPPVTAGGEPAPAATPPKLALQAHERLEPSGAAPAAPPAASTYAPGSAGAQPPPTHFAARTGTDMAGAATPAAALPLPATPFAVQAATDTSGGAPPAAAGTPDGTEQPLQSTLVATAAGPAVPLAPEHSAKIAAQSASAARRRWQPSVSGAGASSIGTPDRVDSGADSLPDAVSSPGPPGSRIHASESMRSIRSMRSTSALAAPSASGAAHLHHAHTMPPSIGGSGRLPGVPSVPSGPGMLSMPSYCNECKDATFKVRNCWEELVCALREAEDFIYITGWSMHPETRLTRTGHLGADGQTIGELLKQKAQDRVNVCLLIWDDKSSLNLPAPLGGLASLLGGSREGMMETHDEVTRSYFAGSDVRCELLQRSGGKGNRLADGTVAAAFFSHHQKAVVCDAPPLPAAASPHRRLVAFLGGLDLTKGRYDTAEHSLFSGREGRFQGDWYNPSLPTDVPDKPREPWHDVHCKVEGAACRDIMRNFEERWLRQVGEAEASQLYASGAGHIGGASDAPSVGQGAGATVQILRSIDGRSAQLDRGVPFPALHYKKGRPIDHSILTAYVHYIRRARNFLYIENQYFIGSSFLWKHDRAWSCFHIIPAEILAKIVSKIRRRERFTAYIVIPLHPEGPPAPDLGQTLLRFQGNTMQSMYRAIAAALAETCDAGMREARRPQDYLVFLTLGRREPEGGGRDTSIQHSPLDHADAFDFVDRRIDGDDDDVPSYASNAVRSRRFMIYVHSKLLVADDEVAIIGSANINMRSMLGTRDTEIAAAIFQPEHLCVRAASAPLSTDSNGSGGGGAATPPPLTSWVAATAAAAAGGDAAAAPQWNCPRGIVHHFRMSLFAEHFGRSSETFRDPHSPACVRQVIKHAQRNWSIYSEDKPAVGAMSGHIMLYPVTVHRSGRLSPRTDGGMFPDAPGAYILPDRIAAPKYPSTLVT
eukprot:jgi/Ulvmu1/11680/UM008_0090.1